MCVCVLFFPDERFGLFTVSSPVGELLLIDRQGSATGDRAYTITQKKNHAHTRTHLTADLIIVWFLCAFECIPMYYSQCACAHGSCTLVPRLFWLQLLIVRQLNADAGDRTLIKRNTHTHLLHFCCYPSSICSPIVCRPTQKMCASLQKI